MLPSRFFSKIPIKSFLSSRLLYNFTSPNNPQKLHQRQQKTYSQIKASQIISQNVGMNQFLMRVYNTTGLSILGALGSTYLFMSMPYVYTNMLSCSLIGFVLTLGGFISTSYMKPVNVVENINGVEIFKTINSPLRVGLYGVGVVGLGLGAAPLFMMVNAMSPGVIPSALGITTAVFGGASLLAYNMPKDKMLGYGGVLMGGLLGLIGLQLIGLLSAVITGPNLFAKLLFDVNNYIGIGLFSALIAYDTHVAIKMYQLRQADHLGMSINMLLNFWNILVRMMSIFSNRNQ